MKRNQLLLFCALLFGMLLFTGCSNESAIEESAVPIVNNIIKENGGDAKCTNVKIIETLDKDTYKGEATLDNGHKVQLTITVKGDQMLVVINE